jgi:hypothetical protein
MSDTIAMPLDLLNQINGGNGQPLCPSCKHGRLHPYKVTFGTNQLLTGMGWQGADFLSGFVAVCVGNGSYLRQRAESGEPSEVEEVPACGFSMPLTPGTRR